MKATAIIFVSLAFACAQSQGGRFDRKGIVRMDKFDSYEMNHTSEATIGGTTAYCNTDASTVHCWEPEVKFYTKILLEGYHGKSGAFIFINTHGAPCNPLDDMARARKGQNVEFVYRYGRYMGSDEIIVPCLFINKHRKEQAGEAHYSLSASEIPE